MASAGASFHFFFNYTSQAELRKAQYQEAGKKAIPTTVENWNVKQNWKQKV